MAARLFAKAFFTLISMASASNTNLTNSSSGILVIGSWNPPSAYPSTEFWSPAASEEASCSLDDYPRDMSEGPTANFVAGHLVACYWDSCESYENDGWTKMADTLSYRRYHSSAQHEDRILLIGGSDSSTTEWIPMDGGRPQEGPFDVRHGYDHCTIQVY